MVKNLSAKAEDASSVPGLGRSPGGGNGTPLQHSCLVNPMNRGAWWATVHGVPNSGTQLSMHTCMHGDRFSKIYQKVSSGWLRVVRLWGNYYIILY